MKKLLNISLFILISFSLSIASQAEEINLTEYDIIIEHYNDNEEISSPNNYNEISPLLYLPCSHGIGCNPLITTKANMAYFQIYNTCKNPLKPCTIAFEYELEVVIKIPGGGQTFNIKKFSGSVYPGIPVIDEIAIYSNYHVSYTFKGNISGYSDSVNVTKSFVMP